MIENPLFYKWVYHPSQEIDSWWNTYLKMNPAEANQILQFKRSFIALDFPQEKLTDIEKKELAKRIIHRLQSIEKKKRRSQFLIGFTRYAAIAILFFSIGGVFVYLQMGKHNNEWYVEETRIPSQLEGPVLILPEGESIALNKTESSLDYSNPDQLVLNNESVIQSGNKNEKLLTNQLIIPYGNRSKITLSDNTVVWLNAGSRLIFPSKFSGKQREVLLFGEAFFDVAANEEIPFVVKTSSLEVKVLGTEFNVSAYPEDNTVQTVLKEGSVSIRKNNSGFFESDIILKPNQMAIFNKNTQNSKVYDVDAAYYTIWVKGLLSFDNQDLSRIIKKIERYYNIQIRYIDPLIGLQKISGKLDLNKNLEEVF
ncbi:MAG: FecR domain-containing protein, partial [Bacteroidota bacterium]|nr:FecR domain-containing protein [Bacteroidota bacterium]